MNNQSPNKAISEISDPKDDSVLLKKKKERAAKTANASRGGSKANKKTYSDREEEKILKYALKLSEMEYQNKKKGESEQKKEGPSMTYQDIEPCMTVVATEENFKNPIAFLDSLWNTDRSTGIIKIIPPKEWKDKNLRMFNEVYTKKFNEWDKKLDTRKIPLNQLYKAKVTFLKINNFNTV